ncbi:MAG: hypothetical protein C4321_00050, partial [Chloroflexota bacterium]
MRALLQSDLAAALDIARSVADDGLDIARFTRGVIDEVRRVLAAVLRDSATADDELVALAKGRSDSVPLLAAALTELARTDFRLDPASPVPLEVACATVALGPYRSFSSAPERAQPPAPAPRPNVPQRPSVTQSPASDSGSLSREERFARDLYEHCKMVNPSHAMWLNGSFEVLQMDGDELVLGFQRKMPLEKVDTVCRAMVEEQAA